MSWSRSATSWTKSNEAVGALDRGEVLGRARIVFRLSGRGCPSTVGRLGQRSAKLHFRKMPQIVLGYTKEYFGRKLVQRILPPNRCTDLPSCRYEPGLEVRQIQLAVDVTVYRL